MRVSMTMLAALCCMAGCAKSENDPATMLPPGSNMQVPEGNPTTPPMPGPGVVPTDMLPGSGGTDPLPGAAGSGAASAAGSGIDGTAGTSALPMPDPEPVGPVLKTIPSARGLCNLNTGFPGDDACLAPPDPDKGFQVHVGPSDYANAAEVEPFLMDPGDESSVCFMKKTANDADVMYMVFEFSGRPGTHHIINTLLSEDLTEGFGSCRSFAAGGTNIGNLGGASKAHMPPVPIAPENERLGIPLGPHTQVQHDMHYFNLTEEPILREFWMNVYYVDPENVTERPLRIMGLGGTGWSFAPIQPGTHMVYPYECPITADGRIVQLLGHTHAHGIRETAHIRRANGERMKVFEQYDYLEPQLFMYDSLAQNPAFSTSSAGAHTGTLEVKAGDVLEWECEVNNDSPTALRYTNEVTTGEMCNIWGMTVGPTISCSRP